MTQDRAPKRSRGRLRFIAAALATIVLVPLLLAGWLLATESGARAVLELARRTSGITIEAEGLAGRLIGPLAAERISVATPDLRVELDAFSLAWRPMSLIDGRLDIDLLSAASIVVATRPDPDATASSPTRPEIALPVAVRAAIAIERVAIVPWDAQDAREPLAFSDIDARLSGALGVQRIDALSVTTPWGQIAALASIDTTRSPHPVGAEVRVVTQRDGHDIELAAQISGDLERLSLRLQANGAGLEGQADAVVAPFAAMPLLELRAAVGEIDPSMFVAGAPSARLHVDADLAGDAATQRLAGEIRVTNAVPGRIDEGRLPLESLLANIDASLGDADIARMELVLADGARLVGDGFATYAAEDVLQTFGMSARIEGLDPAALHGAAPAGRIALEFDADGASDGRAGIRWRFGESRLLGQALGGTGTLSIDGARVPEADVALTLGPSRVTARGAWGRTDDIMEVDAEFAELDALDHGLGGRATLAASVTGGLDALAGELRANAERLSAPGVFVRSLSADGRLGAGENGLVELDIALDALGPDAKKAWIERVDLGIDGTRGEHRVTASVATPEDDRVVLTLRGGIDTAQPGAPRWLGELSMLEADGRFPLRLLAPAELQASAQQVLMGRAGFDAGEKGRIVLDETAWTPDRTTLRGSLSGLQVVEQGERRRRGPGPLTLGAEWEFELAERANGQMRIVREGGDLSVPGELSARLGLEQLEVVVVANDDRLAASIDARGSELGSISGSLTTLAERDEDAGWRLAPNAALLGSIEFDMPSIAWMSRLMQDESVLEGRLQAAFSVTGTPAEPIATGRISGSDLGMSLIEHGVQLSGGTLRAEFERDRLRLRQLEFVTPNRVRPRDARVPVDALTAEPGRLSADGEIDLASGEGEFRFEADRMPVLQRPDRWLLLSGQGRARSTWTSLDVQADFRADAGYVEFAETPPPTLSDDVVIVGSEEDEAGGGGGLAVSADVTVSLGNALYLSALGLETRLAGELALRLRDGSPLAATGTISTVGGSYKGYGQSLTIERGLINFQGPLDNPGLNVVALRKGLPVEAGIAVSGSARRPLIRLVSTPEVPDPEKLSWIVLGRSPSAGGGADMSLLLPAAQALLGGPGGGMTDQLSRSLGVDEFGIGQADSGAPVRSSSVVDGGRAVGEGNVGGQVFTIGKRLSPDLFVSFEQSLGGAESLVKLTYQLTRRISLVARGGTDNAADIFYTITFR
ncbi:translocation/assembly module TamB domain-containing protein [Pseudazoarcus pumilus]|uniref:DUF490 domain-containing protein n=1 Tax=Pseudazoarcus pumilus TaxID=2067960 RepID=A0A2I6S5M0_9RHOO|nr:translocation/assembly module TamB domain-containing protein [Pseudazoarcus pumilus]AUN94559.1 DUF490 domain-containing protein [Pseudazoarcus pumilus]